MHRPVGDQKRARAGIEECAAEPGRCFGAGAGAGGGVARRQHHPVGIELERENLLHREKPVAFDAGDLRRGERQSRLGQPVEIAGNEPMGGEGDDPVMREIECFDVLLVGGLAEVKRFGRIGFERFPA